MTTDHRTALAKVKRFDQLIAYLRDEMGWPIARDSFDDVDDLFFDFTADELGIDPKTAAKIQSIKRLRPLSPRQPWGIFFVKFEPKRLPVVALRRILSQVALKKRASANIADRAAWAPDDLLFVSKYGEGEERQISFAHFSKAPDGHDLPTLKVLGWDNLDTALHLDDVARELTQHLAWPEDEKDAGAWRERWRAAFTLGHREVVTTSKQLSIRLAQLARAIRDRVTAALAIETERGPLTKLMKAFRETLLHDLSVDGFADMYAQTIAYGLLSARIADPHKRTADDFAGHMRTNPFLRELMETFLKVGGRRGKAGGPGIDFDELGVSDVVELLDNANMEAVVRDFGDRSPQEDPVIHFYEGFAKEYDPIDKVRRGEFYTPSAVVVYIVRSVDELLRTEFQLEDGLADVTTWGEMEKRHRDLTIPDGVPREQAFVQILDPATGTGTFLVEVIDVINKTLVEKWTAQGHGERKIEALWNEYVPRHLLTRLHAYELKMAPYAIAHLKVGLKLYETGYRFGRDERARIYLTNALEPASDTTQMKLEGILPALAHEAQAVNRIKENQRFTVVIGNPPYAKLSANWNEWIDSLLHGKGGDSAACRDYYTADGAPLGERTVWIQDDYIKFMRFSQWHIDRSGAGVLGYISNSGYLDNPTLRGMREQLQETFSRVWVLDLHGSAKRGESAPDGTPDKNVFDIQQGVAVGIFVKTSPRQTVEVVHADLWGSRESKYQILSTQAVSGLTWVILHPSSPLHLFVPWDSTHNVEYATGWKVTDIFRHYHSGIITKRDALTIHWTAPDVLRTVSDLVAIPSETARKKYDLPADVRDWKVEWAQEDLRKAGVTKERVIPVLYRPFDIRYTYFTGRSRGFVGWPVADMTRSMLPGANVALVTTRMTKGEDFGHALLSRHMAEVICLSSKTSNNGFVFPLFFSSATDERGLMKEFEAEARSVESNIRPEFCGLLSELVGIKYVPQGSGDHESTFGPQQVLNYIVSVLHSSRYRERYREFLNRDFPRIPLPGSVEVFRSLSRLGGELVATHLMESPALARPSTEFTGGRSPEVEKVSWSKNTVWLDKAQTIGFKGVLEDVWNFHIGGYQVCEKWLKDRKGRTLSKEDRAHYQNVVVALAETIRLMREIDQAIEHHGGWPGAFADGLSTPTVDGALRSVESSALEARDPQPGRLFENVVEPLLSRLAAEGATAPRKAFMREGASAVTPIDELSADDVICAVRQVFADGKVRDRESAIRGLASEFGCDRVGSRIRETFDNALRTGVRRRVLVNTDDGLRLDARGVGDYDREFLKEQFLASLQGRAWRERDDATRGFARWLGFRRTGPAIEDSVRSVVNGLIREGRLESDGSVIRRTGN